MQSARLALALLFLLIVGAWTELERGSGPVTNGVIGSVDPTLLVDGWYDLRIEVTDGGGNVEAWMGQVHSQSAMPVGNMTLEFTDLQIPMLGLPITVRRGYDSRLRSRSGDFGNGWDLDHSSVRITKNKPEGEAWTQNYILLFFTPFWNLYAPEPPAITVDFGRGEVYRFGMDVNPKLKPYTPWQLGDGTQPVYYETTVTGAELYQGVGQPAVVQHDTAYWLFDGSMNLYDPDTYQMLLADDTWVHMSVDTGIMEMSDTQGNLVTFDPTGVTHSAGGSISYVRDAEDRITEVVDPDGDALLYGYTDGNLTSVTDREGNVTTYTYTVDNYLQDVIDPLGVRVLRNYYDDDGRLIRQCDGDNECRELGWDPALRQETVTDREGYVTLTTYDSEGHVIASEDPVGRTTSMTWDGWGNLLTETSAGGGVTTHTYDGVKRSSTTDANGCSEAWTYTGRGRVDEHTDKAGYVTSTTYDAAGHMTERVDRLGAITTFTYDTAGNMASRTTPGGATTSWTFDALGNRLTETDPAGNLTTWTYDGNGRRTSTVTAAGTRTFVYDLEGNLVESVAPDGGVETWAYDSAGREISYTDVLGRTTATTYDFDGNKTSETHPDGGVTEWVWDAEGRKIGEIDPSGATQTWIYDGAGQLIEAIDRDGNSTLSTWDDDGNLVAETDALGNVTTHTYDAIGNRLSTTDPLGNTTTWTYACTGHVLSITSPTGTTTEYTWDAEGRKTQAVRGVGTAVEVIETWVYDDDGHVIQKTAGDGSSWSYTYDLLGNIASVIDPLGQVSTYTWTPSGKMLSSTDADGRTTTYTYDGRGNRTSRTSPSGLVTTWAYDLGGRMTSMTDPAGDVTTYVHDDLDQLIQTTYPDGVVETTTWDAAGNKTSVDLDGATTTYSWDPNRRRIGQVNPDGSDLLWTWNARGQLLEVTGTAAGLSHQITRTYDAAGRLDTVNDGVHSVSYGYDAAGRRTLEARSNGTTSSWSYDDLGRLTDIEHLDPGGVVLASFAYTLDVTGNRIALDEADGSHVDWVYDGAGRLIAETRTGTGAQAASWTYDAAGNRLSQTIDGATTNWAYDSDGRLIDDGERLFTWDAAGRLATIDDGTDYDIHLRDGRGKLVGIDRNGSLLVEYDYDAEGNRVYRSDGVDEEHFLVDAAGPLNRVLLETDGLGGALATHTYGDELLIQERGDVRWYLKDGQGSVRALTDNASALTDNYTYDAWGNGLDALGNSDNAYRYTGEHLDPLTGFYYLRARYLDPSSGRFLSEDPASGQAHDPRTLHLYAYTPADPINHRDPSGESWAALGGMLMNLATRLLPLSVSLSWQAFAIRWAIQMVMWTVLLLIVDYYVISPGFDLMELGSQIGSTIGELIWTAGRCLVLAGLDFMKTQVLWTVVRALLPIVGFLMFLYKIIKFADVGMKIAGQRAIINAAVSNIPDNIPIGAEFSECVERESGVSPAVLTRQLEELKAAARSGGDIDPFIEPIYGTLVPIVQGVRTCGQAAMDAL